jgi:hypothetical protein
MKHLFGKRDGFFVAHPADVNSHQQRGHLVVRDFARSITAHYEADLVARKLIAVALLRNNVNCSHNYSREHYT